MRNDNLLLSAWKSVSGRVRRRHLASYAAGGAVSNRGLAVLLPSIESSEQRLPATEDGCKPRFTPSCKPFKPEKKRIAEWEDSSGVLQWRDKYPYGYGLDLDTLNFRETFRSAAELEWAGTLDRLGLKWEYEPLKFDMGPQHVSYTPDFRIGGLSIRDSRRPLFIEVKLFPDDIDLTKYVRLTDWYNFDLLVLAHEKGGVLSPTKQRCFLVLECTRCGTYDCFSFMEPPLENYQPPYTTPTCGGCKEPFTRIVIPSYFLIQAGVVRGSRVILPSRTSDAREIVCLPFPISPISTGGREFEK